MERIAIGLIRKPHGLKGFMKVTVFSGDLDHFSTLKEFTLQREDRTRQCVVQKVQDIGGELLVKIQGIDSPEAARVYNGWEIWVDRSMAAPLGEQEYYWADLHGCELVYDGSPVGQVVSMIEGPQADLFEVRKNDGSLCYVPFLDEYVGSVDVKARRIELRVDWILG